YADFWQLRRMNVLPRETANYVPAILAMTIIGKNAKDYGLDDLDLERPVEYDTIELVSPTHLGLIADAVDRPLAELKELNPAVLRSVAPAGTALHVPKGTMPLVEAAFRAVPANRRDTWRVHRLDSEDTFATLARRYGTAAALVSSANHDVLPEAGSLVVIPAAYPCDRIPVRTASRTAQHTAARSSTKKAAYGGSRNRTKTRAAVPAKNPTKASTAKGAIGRPG